MKLSEIISDNLFLFSLQATDLFLEHAVKHLWWALFAKKVNN